MYLTQEDRRRMAGEVMVCGFLGDQVGPELREIMREVAPLGLILFGRNVGSAEANMEFTRELKSLRPHQPPLLAVDQEGGRVARLKESVSLWPPMATLGRMHALDPKGAVQVARAVGAALGAEVRCQGFDIDFAPILDVHTNADNPVIGDRAFSSEAPVAAVLGAAFIRGMQGGAAGSHTGLLAPGLGPVGACGKHFPGHGDTAEDSHHHLPTLPHPLQRLEAVEWLPFKAAIEAEVSSIMTAHLVVEPIDSLPATLSHTFLTKYLRHQLGFRGAIISDDVDMKALYDHHAMEDVGPMGLKAGIDVFLACRDPEAIMNLYRGIVVAAEKNTLPHEVLAQRAAMATAWRQRYTREALPTKTAVQSLRRAVDGHRPLVDKLAAFV